MPTLAELAQRFDLELKGDGATRIDGVCSLMPGRPGAIAFVSSAKHRDSLALTQASAVIVAPRDAQALSGSGSGLIAADPYLAYVRIAALFDPDRRFAPGVHARAEVAQDAVLGAGCHVGALAVIESGAQIGAGSFIGPGCIIGHDAVIGDNARLVAGVFIRHGVHIGARLIAEPGAVIGSRGFGNAPTGGGWEEVPQLGSVVVGDDVEIGANTTIDRGALDDTVIEDGVKLDNLIQIAHNCRIGAHTAIAAKTGIAGSTSVGRRCMIGGASAIAGHIVIADDVTILGYSMVTHSIREKGTYGSGLPADEAHEWRRSVARIRRLGTWEKRLRVVERLAGTGAEQGSDDDAGQ